MSRVFLSRISIIFVAIFMCNLFLPFFSYLVSAADDVAVTKDGLITFNTTSRKATTGIRYKTVGFTIAREARCSGDQCAPQSGGDFGEVRIQQVEEIDNGNGTVTTYFEVPEASVSAALESAGLQDISYGGTIYLGSIFHIIRNGNEDPNDYVDLQGIKNAESWADPNGFRQFYDIPVSYTAKFEVTKIHRTSSGQEISRASMDNSNDPDNKWKVGEEIHVSLDETVSFNGKTYSLVKSYLQSKHRLNDQDFVQTGTPSTNPSLANRNFTTHLGGTNVIGVYEEQPNPVKAKFFTEDGTALQTDEDLGSKQTGESVTYTFPDPIVQGGKGYKIIKSYIIDNNDPTNPKFVQVEGQSGLKTRNFTVGDGGTTVIGVYKEAADCSANPTAPECQGGGGGDNNGGGPGCTYIIGPANKGMITSNSQTDPFVNGILRADTRGSEKFNVAQGIPTSESLYANVFGMNYLSSSKWANMTGQVTYTVTVTKVYHKTWTIPGTPSSGPGDPGTPPIPMERDVTVTKNMTVKRDFNYWQIDNLEVYKIDKATVSNYALGGYGGTVTLNPNGYTPPTLVSANDDGVDSHVHPQACSGVDLGTQTVPGGATEPPTPVEDALFQSKAESAVKENKVNNDKVIFNGLTIMDSAQYDKTAPTPETIPQPTIIGQDVLYRNGLVVSNTLVNKANQPTTGKVYYDLIPGNIKGGADKNFDINGMNIVTVHTPTVNYSDASDDAAHNQKTTPDYSRRAFILDRPFTVTIPTSGQHRNIPGYGNRDYAEYIKLKQVFFEFDVYSGDMSKFYPANTWIDIPVNQIVTTFYLPKWVNEGDYTVYYRNFAENSPTSGFTTQQDANLDLANHVAIDTVPVEVIGRVYDFRITDIVDHDWESVFRIAKGSSTPKGTSYWVGPNGIDGDPNGSTYPYVLPILRGSHPLAGYKSVSVKTGYHFKFDLKTKGNMFGDRDAIRITPTFYFQDNDPSTPASRITVDLYYHSDSKKFIRVGSADDVERREIILNNRLRNVPYSDIVNTAGSIYDMNTGWTMTRDQYVNAFVKRSTEPTYVGGYDVQILPSPLRMFINTFDRPSNANATPARVNASVQQWYGEYSLPAAVYAVPKGTDLAAYGRTNRLDDKSPIFLKNGYITVNFNIETIRNADLANPHLQYIHGPLNNQWWDMEGFDSSDGSRDHIITDPYGVQFKIEDGDVVFYDAQKSSYDDYTPNGTH